MALVRSLPGMGAVLTAEFIALVGCVSRFPSGDTTCAAWHYEGVNGGCVVMSGGLAVTKEPATDRFAARYDLGESQNARCTAGFSSNSDRNTTTPSTMDALTL